MKLGDSTEVDGTIEAIDATAVTRDEFLISFTVDDGEDYVFNIFSIEVARSLLQQVARLRPWIDYHPDRNP